MSWIFIAIAVVFEVTVGIAAGKAQGFKNIPWTATTLIAGALGTYFLSLALLSFDVGVGYAIWTSVSGVGIVVVGALFLGQQLTWSKLLNILVVIWRRARLIERILYFERQNWSQLPFHRHL